MWNFNMDEAPKSFIKTETHIQKGKEVERKTLVQVKLFLAGKDDLVTPSYWMPDQGRWNMFTKDCQPIAFMEWPTHPHKGDQHD